MKTFNITITVDENKLGKEAFSHEIGLLGQKIGFSIDDIVEVTKTSKIKAELGFFIANDESEHTEIIEALREKLKTEPNTIVDFVKFNTAGDTIQVIDKLEFSCTVKTFCDLIGLRAE